MILRSEITLSLRIINFAKNVVFLVVVSGSFRMSIFGLPTEAFILLLDYR